MIEELKTCPFCGGKVRLYYFKGSYHQRVTISCKDCKIRSVQESKSYKDDDLPREAYMNKSIKLWNRRVDDKE